MPTNPNSTTNPAPTGPAIENQREEQGVAGQSENHGQGQDLDKDSEGAAQLGDAGKRAFP